MTLIAPIGPPRIVGIQPAQPMPGSDPSDDGLDVDVITEPAPMGIISDDAVTAVGETAEANVSANQNAFAVNAAAQVNALAPQITGRSLFPRPQGGNANVSTGFDRSPVLAEPAQRQVAANASPVARAYAAWAR